MEAEHKKQQANIWMIIAIILLIICVGEAYFIHHKREENTEIAVGAKNSMQQYQRPPSMPSGRPKPTLLMKGDKFADNPISAKAYLISPVTGDLSVEAKTALTGWNLKTTANSDGSTQIDLIPREAEDIKQSFTVKPGYKLYFIEMSLVDDQTGVDKNRGDDIGVLVNPNGIVQ